MLFLLVLDNLLIDVETDPSFNDFLFLMTLIDNEIAEYLDFFSIGLNLLDNSLGLMRVIFT